VFPNSPPPAGLICRRRPATLNVVARKKSFAEQAAEYSTLAFAIPAGAFVGWLLGHFLDRAFGTAYLTVGGVILGVVAGFVKLIQQAMRDIHDSER